MSTEQSTKAIIVAFYRPCSWWGWIIAYYQLLLRIKYWQVTHVELLTEEGLYAYRINKTIIASIEEDWYEPDYRVFLPDHGTNERMSTAWALRRAWGDFSPLSPFNGNHCVRWVNRLIGNKNIINLPGNLLMALELRDVRRTVHDTNNDA